LVQLIFQLFENGQLDGENNAKGVKIAKSKICLKLQAPEQTTMPLKHPLNPQTTLPLPTCYAHNATIALKK
jgi:hypothetical protein